MSAGHLIVRQLEAEGVRRAFLVPGESFLDVLDGLYESEISTVVCRHEGGAGFMALTEGRLGNVPGVCLVTRGPGAANAMIAVHTAWQDATAMVLFVGLIAVADRDRFSFQEFDIRAWFGDTAKKVFVLDDPSHAAQTVRDAMHLARSGRPGPVVIGLPEDLLRQPVGPSTVLAPIPSIRAELTASNLEHLRAALSAADRPLIVAGGDGWDRRASQLLSDWAARQLIPVVTDWRAYDVIAHDSPAYAGWLGYGRADTLADHLAASDLIIYVGCVRTDVNSDGFTLAQETPTIVVTPDTTLTGHSGRTDQVVLSDPGPFVEALTINLDEAPSRSDAWIRLLHGDQVRFASFDDSSGDPNLVEIFRILNDYLDDDAVLTFGAGNATLWAHRFVAHRRPQTLVGARNGAMGLAVPAAVAASIAQPERRAIAVCGDGDFLMNGQEFATAVAYGATPVAIVIDNGVYGTIVDHQERAYPGRPSGITLTNPDFVAWAQSFGAYGERVAETAQFEPAMIRALESHKAVIIHVVVDPSITPPSTTNRPHTSHVRESEVL